MPNPKGQSRQREKGQVNMLLRIAAVSEEGESFFELRQFVLLLREVQKNFAPTHGFNFLTAAGSNGFDHFAPLSNQNSF